MNFITKYTRGGDGDIYSPSLQEIKKDDYFDKVGVLQPGHACVWTFNKGGWKGHCAMMAMMQWGIADLEVEGKKKMKLRFATFNTPFVHEIQLLLAMMRWDWMSRGFKLMVLGAGLRRKGTTLGAVMAEAEAMKKEQDKLFDIGEIKVRMRKTRGRWCWDFLAAVHIQRWWLRKKRTFRIYKDMYQLIDGICGGNSREYVGDTPRQEKIRDTLLLGIQERALDALRDRRAACARAACTFMRGVLHKTIHRRSFFAKLPHDQVWGIGPAARWGESDVPYLCTPCATSDLSYLGGGRSSGNLKDPRWATACLRCGLPNPFYSGYSRDACDLGDDWGCDSGDEGSPGVTVSMGSGAAVGREAEEGWLGKWGRRLGLTPFTWT